MSQKALTEGSECPPLEKGVLRLYSMRLCPYAQRTRIVLEHKKIPYEVVNVALSKWKPQWYFNKNPFGTVPCLEQDGKLIYESIVCSDYLDEIYPDPKLTPSDPYQKARDRMLLEKWSKAVADNYSVLRTRGKDEQVLADLHAHLAVMEQALAERGTPFFGGEQPMMIDFNIWPHMERILVTKIMLSIDFPYPKLTDWVETITAVPAVKATQTSTEVHIAFYLSLAAGAANYDAGSVEAGRAMTFLGMFVSGVLKVLAMKQKRNISFRTTMASFLACVFLLAGVLFYL